MTDTTVRESRPETARRLLAERARETLREVEAAWERLQTGTNVNLIPVLLAAMLRFLPAAADYEEDAPLRRALGGERMRRIEDTLSEKIERWKESAFEVADIMDGPLDWAARAIDGAMREILDD